MPVVSEQPHPKGVYSEASVKPSEVKPAATAGDSRARRLGETPWSPLTWRGRQIQTRQWRMAGTKAARARPQRLTPSPALLPRGALGGPLRPGEVELLCRGEAAPAPQPPEPSAPESWAPLASPGAAIGSRTSRSFRADRQGSLRDSRSGLSGPQRGAAKREGPARRALGGEPRGSKT